MSTNAFLITLIVSFIASLCAINYIAKRISFKMKVLLTVIAIAICNWDGKPVSEISPYISVVHFSFCIAFGIYIISRIKEFWCSLSNDDNITYNKTENTREFFENMNLTLLKKEYSDINKEISRLEDEKLRYPTKGTILGFGQGLSKSEQNYNQRKCDEINRRITDLENKKRNIENTAMCLGGSVTDN